MSYGDNNLAVHDLVNGTDRLLTKAESSEEHSAGALLSRDGSRIAYNWYMPLTGYELRVASLQGAGVPPSRLLYDSEELNTVYPNDWSPDGESIAVVTDRKDRTMQIGIIRVRDGALRILKSTDWKGQPGGVFFSPDGQYLAFDLPANETSDQRDVFVMTTDGSRQIPAVVHTADDRVMGWSPDGKYLLFKGDRRGNMDLWGLPFSKGAPQGAPELMYSNIGSNSPLGVTSAGSLYLKSESRADRDIIVATIDLETGKPFAPPVRPAQRFVGNLLPDWSKDGKYLAFVSERNSAQVGRARVIVIQAADTGQVVREIRPKIDQPDSLRWAPDGRSFVMAAIDMKGRIGVIRVDAMTGEAETITAPRDGYWRGLSPESSPDGTKIYYSNLAGGETLAVIERDLTSGSEREVLRRNLKPFGVAINSAINLSPDGRWIASWNKPLLMLYPVAGGDARELLRPNEGDTFTGALMWGADGKGLFVNKNIAGGGQEKWFVPLAGEAPTKLAANFQFGRLHPDGRRVAAVVIQPRPAEVRVLENFLPAANDNRRPR